MGNELGLIEIGMIEMGVSKGRTTYIVAHEQGYQQRSQPFYASQNAHLFLSIMAQMYKK